MPPLYSKQFVIIKHIDTIFVIVFEECKLCGFHGDFTLCEFFIQFSFIRIHPTGRIKLNTDNMIAELLFKLALAICEKDCHKLVCTINRKVFESNKFSRLAESTKI